MNNENPTARSDRELGMARSIPRRDFLNGAALAVGSVLVSGSLRELQSTARNEEVQSRLGYNPPVATGLRGSQPGSFEIAHSLRDGTFWKTAPAPQSLDESYDLIIVGAGISGLAAAHFYRERAGAKSKILILENHDDFGGHARRNEFHLGGKLQLLNGGTLLIDSPTAYSAVAAGLLTKLGVDPVALDKKFTDHSFYRSRGMGSAVFFDRETFGADRMVKSPHEIEDGGSYGAADSTWKEFLEKAPLSEVARRDLLRIETQKVDYLPGLTSTQKKDRLSRISYKDFLLNVAKVDPAVATFYQTRTNGEWGVGVDAEPALDCWALGLPGFQGMNLEPGSAPRMSYSGAGYANGGSPRFHFPDGNATIARLLVRSLIPAAMTGNSVEDIVTAVADYAQLDSPGSPVRIRLNSTVVRARNLADDPAKASEVEIAYASGKSVYTVHAKACVLACWNMAIPFLVPELPASQREALHYLVKVPLVYASIGLRDWTSFDKLKVSSAHCPGAYWNSFALNWSVNIGEYRSPRTPGEPILLHLSRTPCRPGLPAREQHKAGRSELLITPFETFERKIRDQLARALSAGGFDPARDIEAITVNRWPHGYGYEYNPLFDPEWLAGQAPHEIGRRRFGRIAIANTDSGATAYTDVAIDQAYRAATELLSI